MLNFHFREEIEKQRKAANYRKLHAQGKTEEARADLERLAIIRKQREEAQKKRDDEKAGMNDKTYFQVNIKINDVVIFLQPKKLLWQTRKKKWLKQ